MDEKRSVYLEKHDILLKNGFYQKSVIDFSFVNKWCSSTYRIVTQSQDDQILISMVEG